MKVSVAVPARNEEATIERLIDSLVAQTHLPDEIVIADGGSTDQTVDVARRYEARGVRVLEIGPAYPGRGRNEAIKACRNEWIALIDAGCVADPRWLECLAATAAQLPGWGVVMGDCRPVLTTEWDFAQALVFVGFDAADARFRPKFVASSLLHRTAWERAGGFPEDIRAAEDLIFWQAIEKADVPRLRNPEAAVFWRMASGPRAVFRRMRLYSTHHMAAGLARTWHSRVMLMDTAGIALLLASIKWPVALALLAAGAAARVLRTIARQSGNIADAPARAFDPVRCVRVGWLLAVSDAATWMGALDYALKGVPKR